LVYEEGKLLIVNLDRDVPESRFKDLFSKFGEIIHYKLCEDNSTGLRNGKAWVLYKTSKQAERCLDELDGLSLNNRSIEIKRSLKKGFTPADQNNFTSKQKFQGQTSGSSGFGGAGAASGSRKDGKIY
jgi:RNA recognition motif-containing protein